VGTRLPPSRPWERGASTSQPIGERDMTEMTIQEAAWWVAHHVHDVNAPLETALEQTALEVGVPAGIVDHCYEQWMNQGERGRGKAEGQRETHALRTTAGARAWRRVFTGHPRRRSRDHDPMGWAAGSRAAPAAPLTPRPPAPRLAPPGAGLVHVMCHFVKDPPKCRHEHRLKQHPRWKVEQVNRGTFRWTAPSGRQYTTEATRYPI